MKKQSENLPTEPAEGNLPGDWMKKGTFLAASCELKTHVCVTGNCLETQAEQHCQSAKLFGRLSMSERSEIELVADCRGVTEVNLKTALGFYSMTSSIGSLACLERAQELVTALSVEVFLESLQAEQKIESSREPLDNELSKKHRYGYH